MEGFGFGEGGYGMLDWKGLVSRIAIGVWSTDYLLPGAGF